MSVLFWDFDGTLVYSYSLWSGSIHRALTLTDPQTSVTYWDIKKQTAGIYTWDAPERDHTAFVGEAWWDLMNTRIFKSYRRCGVREDAAEIAAKRVRDIIKLPQNYHLFPDAVSTLAQLKARGHKNIILSNNYPDLADVLKAIGLFPLFDDIIISALEGYDKPRRELFELAKDRFPSDRYYMIGDNEQADILGAKAAGINSVYVHKGSSAAATYSFDNLQPILQL